MNYMRKKSAVTKYKDLLDEKFTNIDEVKAALAKDDLHFEKTEIEEIIAEMIDPTPPKSKEEKKEEKKEPVVEKAEEPATTTTRKKPEPTDQPVKRVGTLKHFYRYKVKQVHETIVLRGRKEEILKGFERTGDCLQVTQIDPKHAEILNQQTPNTMMYYFEENQSGFLAAENFF